jgi:flagellar assembly protein FliH
MSSFEILAPPEGTAVAKAVFTPLGEGGVEAAAPAEGWRPLFGVAPDPHRDGMGAPADPGATVADTEAPSGPGGPRHLETAGGSFAAGYERGRQEARAEVEVLAESLVQSLHELGEFRARLVQRYERELLELALGIARKVLRGALEARPEIWLTMIRDGIRRAVDREEIAVRVPAPLAAFLAERLPELRAGLDDVRALKIVDDPTMTAGACVIETRLAEIELGLEAQMEQIERGLGRAG